MTLIRMAVTVRQCGCVVENGTIITTCGRAGHTVGGN